MCNTSSVQLGFIPIKRPGVWNDTIPKANHKDLWDVSGKERTRDGILLKLSCTLTNTARYIICLLIRTATETL